MGREGGSSLLLAALVLATTGAMGADDGALERATALARERWKAHFRELAPVQSPRLRTFLGECPVYRATVFNPKSVIAGRPTFLHTLVLRADGPVFIERDEEATALLSQAKREVADAAAALDATLAFGDLRNHPIQTRPRAGRNGAVVPDDWAVVIQETQDGWSVACTFLVDPTIQACVRYQLAISRGGRLAAKAGALVSARGGYR